MREIRSYPSIRSESGGASPFIVIRHQRGITVPVGVLQLPRSYQHPVFMFSMYQHSDDFLRSPQDKQDKQDHPPVIL